MCHAAAGAIMNLKKVLLVDDESDVTRILSKRLERRGYECAAAANGQEALEAMQQYAYSVVIMDVKMPVMDGMSALQHIHSQWPATKVILLSGHADMQLAVQAMSDGAFGYLMKPVDLEELLFKIEDAATQFSLEAG
jgi:two-component system, OmpR family, response regulator